MRQQRTLGTDVPQGLLALADEVMELASNRLMQCKLTTKARAVVGQLQRFGRAPATSAVTPKLKFACTAISYVVGHKASDPIEVPQTISASIPASANDSMTPMCDHPRAEPLPNASPMRGVVMKVRDPKSPFEEKG